ncbi:hypothetical protein HMSSN036_70320 [Paenibacillus macerans]|nr:hypothetical protein HMSSN036_70320 [Paenibacillus macerans]
MICPMIVPEKEDRILPVHTIFHEDPELVSALGKEEYEDFRSMGVVLDRYTWTRYADEIVTGCKIADEAFLAKIKANYGFSFPIDREFMGPALFLLGRQDASVGYADALRLLNLFPRARLPFWIGQDIICRSSRRMCSMRWLTNGWIGLKRRWANSFPFVNI